MNPAFARLCFYGRVFYRTFDLKPDEPPRETGFLYLVPLPTFPLEPELRKLEAAWKGNDGT